MGERSRQGRAGAAAAAVLVALLATACGQTASARERRELITLAVQARPTPTPTAHPLASPNGENSGPLATVRYTVITHTRVVNRTSGPNPLHGCPVYGRGFFSDDFGAPRYAGGFHLHQGNDIFAALGTPIVAPFDGMAVTDANSLGGLAVIVRGAQGWVYNAHLSRYGKLGPVHAGDVIGYVGNTGDARGGATHDHFEWHPSAPAPRYRSAYGAVVIGSAVDPYPYLLAACSARTH